MSGWIASLGAGQLGNWDICVRESLFGSGARVSRSVRAGDDVFIWLAQGGLKAHCRATADAKTVDADTWLPWPPKAEGRYFSVIPIKVLVELPEPIERSWTDIKKLVGVTSSPQFFPKVDGTGLHVLRGLFTCSIGIDIRFLPALDLEYLGQDHRHVANRAIAYRRGQSAFRNASFGPTRVAAR